MNDAPPCGLLVLLLHVTCSVVDGGALPTHGADPLQRDRARGAQQLRAVLQLQQVSAMSIDDVYR